MHQERFLNLITVLEAVPEDKLNMKIWWESECGTAGCAIGHYCVAYPHLDMKLVFIGNGSPGFIIDDTYTHSLSDGPFLTYNIIANHFEITELEALWLFAGYNKSNKSKSSVLGRLLKFYNDNLPQEPVEFAEEKELCLV